VLNTGVKGVAFATLADGRWRRLYQGSINFIQLQVRLVSCSIVQRHRNLSLLGRFYYNGERLVSRLRRSRMSCAGWLFWYQPVGRDVAVGGC